MTRRPNGGAWAWGWMLACALLRVALAGLPLARALPALAAEPSPDTTASVRVRDTAAESARSEAPTPYVVEPRPAPAVTPAPSPPPPPPTSGERLAAFALQYLGYPYVWAGNTPAGFDCSGFTQFVVLNVLGVDIGHGLQGQTAAGAWVEWGTWQPGDLIFFQSTYQPGLSHVGLYLGNGQFIHAENEGTGVVISSVYSAYYASRYWGAVRVA